jgi:NAD(P)-dependent dehydrogenase (short-subunit alcohol dehydrogenase family)
MLLASPEGHVVNTSSVNGFWASLGPQTPHTSYSAAKFAVKGFTEALLNDFRLNAPHVKVSLVMPGHIGTSIVINSGRVLGQDPKEMSDEELQTARERMERLGFEASGVTNGQIRQLLQMLAEQFRDNAPMTAAEAAKVILDGVRKEQWRILVGDDAHALDRMVRETPEEAYEPSFMERVRAKVDWKIGL